MGERELHTLTPVEETGGVLFKREDFFAPLGYGGINGSKLRQCIWLVSEYAKGAPERCGLLSGASVKSPQLSMGAAVARHYGLPSVLVVGATNPASAEKHENVAIASLLGARFHYASVAYNPVLQKTVRDLASTDAYRAYFRLEYGITVPDEDDARVEAFHRLGSEQVRNLPSVENLVMPAGSCNSCVSVLYGLARFRPDIKTITLFGIGPTRLDFIDRRLASIERISGLSIRSLFRRTYHQHPEVAVQQNAGSIDGAPYQLVHHDLHHMKFADYQDEMPWSHGDIVFHPTYEGKVMRYLHLHAADFPWFWGGSSLFWIVGSRPTRDAMVSVLRPTLDRLYA